MASTIIIKNGTSGTPNVADMSQGEMAMNVANGQLFYGTVGGTAVSSSFTFTQVTASNAKISNAVIDLPDENALTMGGESFTAAVIMNQATLASTVGVAANNTADETVYLTHVDGATGTQAIETDTGLTYNPASNYVTASGGFLAQSVEGIYADKIRRATDSGTTTKITLNDEILKFHAGHSSNETLNLQLTQATITPPVTASGDISSSGTIRATAYEIQGKTVATFSDPNMTFGQANKITILRGDEIRIGTDATQHITASGHISSSGNIISANHEILTAQTFKYVDLDDGYYGMPGNAGYSSTTWGFQKTNGAEGMANGAQHVGVKLPYKAILIGVTGQFRASITGDTSWDDSGGGPFNFALWTCAVGDGEGYTATTWAETIKTADISIGTNKQSFPYNFERLDGTTAFAKGTSIMPSFLNESGLDNVDIFGNYTIVIQRVNI